MAQIIAFANQKGGVGKTTTAVNIGASLATIGRRVLLVDLDSQGNAGTGLGFVRSMHKQSVYSVLMGSSPAAENILTTAIPNMHIMPSTMQLADAEVELMDMERREYRLRDALAQIADHYDYILLDCPPALGLITINSLVASNYVIIPMQCEFYALEGITHMVNSIREVHNRWNPELEILGVLLTMYTKQYGMTHAVEDDVRKKFGDAVFKTVVPRNVRVSEAPSHGKPALFYDFNSSGAQAYLRVATEVIQKTEQGA
ncbi:MAG: ParA family protein [Alphaproteobacteria bacterium]|nr:ParA family protein [Alphaproteobacteria bacterium]